MNATKSTREKRVFFAAVLLSITLSQSCETVPKPLSDAERLSISAAGGNAELLDRMLLSRGNSKIDSLLIFRDDVLLMERYRNGYDAESPHDIRSATKSITSLLVGIAIEKGFISGIDQSILDYFPEQATRHPEFKAIRVKDLLTMSSGLDSDDWDPASPGNEENMYRKNSWVDFFFSLSVLEKPGVRFRYSTAGVVLLGELVKRASGMRFDVFADKYLFGKLGITEYAYARTPSGEIDSGGHLRIKPPDFAKIGLLMLRQGVWKGESVVSEKWVRDTINPAMLVTGAPSDKGPYMGYLWWQEPVVEGEVRSFQARGNGGQFLIAVPGEGLLGVFTGSAFNDPRQLRPFALMSAFVIPAFGQR